MKKASFLLVCLTAFVCFSCQEKSNINRAQSVEEKEKTWKIGTYVNEFDEPTDNHYVYQKFDAKMTGSNIDGYVPVTAKFMFEDDNLSISLYYDKHILETKGPWAEDVCIKGDDSIKTVFRNVSCYEGTLAFSRETTDSIIKLFDASEVIKMRLWISTYTGGKFINLSFNSDKSLKETINKANKE